MAHNAGPYIRECIQSVWNQTLNKSHWEYIVVDAGSTDNTWKEIHAPGFPIRRTGCIQDYGLSTSRNEGYKWASGDYYVTIDADDKIHPQFLEKLLPLMADKTIVCPGMQEFDGSSNAGYPCWGTTYQDFQLQNRIFCCSMFPAKDFWEVGGYDANLNWLGFEDWCLWLDLVKNGCQVKILPEILYYHRGSASHGHRNSSATRTAQRHEERMQYLHKKHGVPV